MARDGSETATKTLSTDDVIKSMSEQLAAAFELREMIIERPRIARVSLARRPKRRSASLGRCEGASDLKEVECRKFEQKDAVPIHQTTKAEKEEEAQKRLRDQLQQREEEERLCSRLDKEQQEREMKEDAADFAKLQAFLKRHGFKDVNAKRTRMFKSKYALHSAVKMNDASIVRSLLNHGANPAARNSAGKTPVELARDLQENGSHALVLALLTSGWGVR
eukprot:TRINITY_DN33189_c0_g1_i1.p1 TRINITY_DN33189_c0_g1~~TRINITY_DN33189_c0_g1_i1.p1  ORF type:complete len:221 (-),score=57.83 TRINITY_DN33189_c0_g1_i1:68-730(-)